MDVINKIAAMSPLTSKKETQAFLGVVGFQRMNIPNYSQIVSSIYRVTWKKNNFERGLSNDKPLNKLNKKSFMQ